MTRPGLRAKRLAWGLAAAWVWAAGATGAAAMTAKDMEVAARALAHLEGRDFRHLHVAIVYAPANPASRREADELAAMIGQSYTAGSTTLVADPPVVVSTDRLDQLNGKDVLFVTEGLAAWQPAIAAAASARHIVTVTSDFQCVSDGYCVLGVQSAPRVQILVNRKAAEKSAVQFEAGFLMLVREL